MEETAKEEPMKKAGVDRRHSPSMGPKAIFWGLHGGLVLICAWLVLGQEWIAVPDVTRGLIMVGCAALYWLRHGVTLFYLLQRKLDLAEAFGLLAFMAFFEIGLTVIGSGMLRGAPVPWGVLDTIGVALLVFGSYLNSGSEIGRKWWKKDPANKGHCYTGGLFKYSMHINYFGDVVLFSGWALLSASLFSLGLPAMMAAMFIFMHIPGLDDYLAKRYGAEFEAYAAKTAKLVPWVY